MPTTAIKRTTFISNVDQPDMTAFFQGLVPLSLNGLCYIGEQATFFDQNGNFTFQSFSIIVISIDDAAVLQALNDLISAQNIPITDVSSFSENVSYGLS